MSDSGGTFRIITSAKMVNNKPLEIDLGEIQSITESFSAKVSPVGIPSQPCENTFLYDSGVTLTYSVSFARSIPRNPIDSYSTSSLNWSNGFWIYNILKYVVNRWQAKTDGVRTYYIPDGNSNTLFNGWGFVYNSDGTVTKNGVNCYVSEFIPHYNLGVERIISGSMSFIVGGLNLSNILKSSITYFANFGALSSDMSADTTNVAVIKDDFSFSAITYPSTWLQYMVNKKAITPSFAGWATSPTGNVVYEEGDPVTVDGALRLYARYNNEDS